MKLLNQFYPNFMTFCPLNKALFVVLSTLLTASMSAHAEQVPTATVECGEADIRYIDDPSLTKAEKIALMEKAFFDSLNRFESCNLSAPSSSSSQNSNNANAGAGSEQVGNTGSDSVASQEMQGTEPESPYLMSSEAGELSIQEDTNLNSTVPSADVSNGAIPEDIPSTNNDDAIASQIRLAAEVEQDPEIKKKLWNEYRKYKGMDVVED